MYVEDVVVHPEFQHYQHDLALLRLPRPLPHLTPLCLPPHSEEDNDSFIGMRSDHFYNEEHFYISSPRSQMCGHGLGSDHQGRGAGGQAAPGGAQGPEQHGLWPGDIGVRSLWWSLVSVQVYSLRYGVDITTEHLCAGPDPGTVTGTCVVSVQRIFRE